MGPYMFLARWKAACNFAISWEDRSNTTEGNSVNSAEEGVQALVLWSDHLMSQTLWVQPSHSWAQQVEQQDCPVHVWWTRAGRAEHQGHAADFEACAASQLLPLHPPTSTKQQHCRTARALFLSLGMLLLARTWPEEGTRLMEIKAPS